MSVESDPRFSHVATDPRFKAIPRKARKVQIDSRFQSMFTGDAFKVKYSVDKRGRKVGGSSSEDLCKYYQLPEDPREAGLEDNGATSRNKKTGTLEEEEEEEEEEEADEAISSLSDASSDTDDESNSELEEEEVIHSWGEVGSSVPETRDTSSRLAICNMDWDRITAQDLYVLLNSFKPPGGVIHSVTIFPSDFGLEKMAKEEVEGPGEGGGEEGEEGSGFSREKLRQYQMNRLKYFYAVVDCDTKATAESVYEQCDGLEYERSGGRLDLRFIPEDMTFNDREPKAVATELLVPADYQPCDFFSSALQQSKVQLTWDEAEPRRLQTTMRKFTKEDLQSMDFSAYLASSGSDEEEGEEEGGEGEEKQIQKYRALLEEGREKGKKEEEEEELEITWEPGLQKGVEELVKKKTALREASQSTIWENYQRERRKKKKERKSGQGNAGEEEMREEEEEEKEDIGFDDPFFQHDVTKATAQSQKKKSQKQKMSRQEEKQQQQEKSELELLVMEEEGDEREHFSLKGILKREKEEKRRKKRKRKMPEEEAPGSYFEVDIADPRFAALYESHQFAPDPSHPQYRPTKAMAAIITERQKRGRGKGTTGATMMDESGTRTLEPSVSALVKSVKSKVGSFSKSKHHKKQRLKAR